MRVRIYPLLLLLFFASFMIAPLWHVVSQAFLYNGEISAHFFRVMVETEHYRDILCNSLNLAIAVTIITTLIAYPLALTFSRTRLPTHGFLHSLLLLPLIVPPFVGVLGVRQLFSRFGSVNILLMNHGVINEPINWLGGGGVVGIIALQVIHLVPLLYLSVSASLQNAHVSLEEAARIVGASRWRILRSIITPLSLPGWFAGATLVFIASFTDLGTPLVFEYRNVISVQIYNMLSDLHENPVGYSFVVFTCILSISLFLLSKASLMNGAFAGSARATQGLLTQPLRGFFGSLTVAAIALYIVIASVPQFAVLTIALSGRWFMSVLPEEWTLHHFAEVLYHPLTAHSLLVSFGLSAAASILTLIIGLLTSYRISRGGRLSRVVFEALSLVPLAIPGIVFAFGFIAAFSGTILDNRINPFPLLIAAYTVRRLPAMVRSATAGLQEANILLEEAAYMVGASRFRTTCTIVLPLIARHLIVGAMLTFSYSMIEVSDSLLLALEAKFYPVSKAIYALMGRPDGVELASALGVVVMIIMALTFYLSERLSRRSATRRALCIAPIFAALMHCAPCSAETDEIIVVTPHWEGIKSEFTRGFSEQWRARTGHDITVRWLDVGGTSDIVKYIKGQFKSTPNGIGIDVMFGGGLDSFLELEANRLLEPAAVSDAVLNAIPQQISGIPIYSPEHLWFANALSAFGILYNDVAVQRLKLPVPARWSDLARPEFFDLVGAGDPRKSGSMHAMYEILLQGYGWQEGWRLIQRFARNVRNFSSVASQVGKEVTTGEIIYGIAIDTYAGDAIRQVGGDRLKFIIPSDFAAINGDGIALLKGAPHRQAASAFIEFTLSEAGQRLWYSRKGTPGGPQKSELGKLPVLPTLYGAVEPATVYSGNPFSLPNLLKYDAATAGQRWNLINDLFGTFVVDVHDRLVRTDSENVGRGIPISEDESQELSAGGIWGSDTVRRTQMLKLWGEQARAALPIQLSRAERWKWIPSLLLALFLLTVIGVRASRRAARWRGKRS
jgi:iron(III) transport system permease protein